MLKSIFRYIQSSVLFILLSIPSILAGQGEFPQYILDNVFQFGFKNEAATCFQVQRNNRRFIVTAKHLIEGIQNRQAISFGIRKNDKWDAHSGIAYIDTMKETDIVVIESAFSSPGQIHFNLSVPSEVGLGDEGWFFGYPSGLFTHLTGPIKIEYPTALVKKAFYSGWQNVDQIAVKFYDGLSAKGFSGAPIVFKNRYTADENDWVLHGIVAGYHTQYNELKSESLKVIFFMFFS